MFTFKQITETNGIDINNLKNSRQNSYAWSMAELGNYIYVGTSRNMISSLTTAFTESPNLAPSLVTGSDNNAEIWRYKKDGSCPWEKVFKASSKDKIYGFRAMITHKSNNSCAIYAASMGEKVYVFKSTDGVHWKKINTSNVSGRSSRAFASFNGKLYMATLEEGIGGNVPYLYSSKDPEFELFKLVINPKSKGFIPNNNPIGGIDDLSVFNNRLYLSIGNSDGAEVWRSNNCNPKNNDWTLVAYKGFGDALNTNIMSTGVFKDHLYVAVTKRFPLSLFVPLSFDLIRIDKNDCWEIVVGGKPIIPSCPSTGVRNKSLSGFNSGFNNFFNVYGWQIKEFKGNLVITTYDSSTNIRTFITGFEYNKEDYIKNFGYENYNRLLNSYKKIYKLLCKYNYPKGFDIYTSKDGLNFSPVILDGLNDPNNYGGRTLLVSSENKLYVGTANPFLGLEVWEADYNNSNKYCSNNEIHEYFSNLKKLNKELLALYPELMDVLQRTFPAFQ